MKFLAPKRDRIFRLSDPLRAFMVANSVNVSAARVMDQVRESKIANLPKIGVMLREWASDRVEFLIVRIVHESSRVLVSVVDNGAGIPPENPTRIFAHGFTTKKDGHGFGLHSRALVAKELGGSLHAHGSGLGRGAVFTLELPFKNETSAS